MINGVGFIDCSGHHLRIDMILSYKEKYTSDGRRVQVFDRRGTEYIFKGTIKEFQAKLEEIWNYVYA
jgi:hypothetical protein